MWEEVIIHCPTTIQMLAMSATVANPEDLGAWIRKVGWGRPSQAGCRACERSVRGPAMGCCLVGVALRHVLCSVVCMQPDR